MRRHFQFSSTILQCSRLFGGLIASILATTALAATQPDRVQLTLPAPTGPHHIGTISLHLVDQTRQDPFWSTPRARELMVSVWYPARPITETPAQHAAKPADLWQLAPWMPSAALAYYRSELEDFLSRDPGVIFPPGTPPPSDQPLPGGGGSTSAPVSLAGVDFPITHARLGAPVERSAEPYPVVIYSPGFAHDREQGTTLVEDLASHGYIVVTISHTFESSEVEFPGGRVELARPADPNNVQANDTVSIRRADVQFVLDKLGELAANANPDAEHRPLPAGLRGCLNMGKIGIFGHSLGGATVAQSMAHDHRIIAGINLDGSFLPDDVNLLTASPAEVTAALVRLAHKIDRPFMIMGSWPLLPDGSDLTPDSYGNLTSTVWYNLIGYRRFVALMGSTHGSYTDDETLLPQLVTAGIIASADSWVGTINSARAIAAQRAYIRAFFDLWLRDRDNHLLDGPSVEYPEAKFL